jgi:hypothetical protein
MKFSGGSVMGSDQAPESRLLEIIDVLVVVRAGAVEIADMTAAAASGEEVRLEVAAVMPPEELLVVVGEGDL